MKYIRMVALSACLAATALFAAEVPQVGQQAPNFKLPSQDGTEHGLKDYKGKYVVLYFYPKDMTQGCTIEAHGFQMTCRNTMRPRPSSSESASIPLTAIKNSARRTA